MSEDVLEKIDPRALGVRLRWAREARKWTQKRVADEVGLARTTLVAIEKGERRVKPEELVKMAHIYGRRLNDLLQIQMLDEDFIVQLRSTAPSAKASGKLGGAVEHFERLCEDYMRLETICRAPLQRNFPPIYHLSGVDPEIAAEDVAGTERRRLAIGDGPLVNLREMLESDVGLRIFFMKMPSNVAGMFTFTERLGGCIAVNVNHPPERIRHSLTHEYGHFLTARSRPRIYYDMRYERRPTSERFAESFGRAFLMPADGLRRRFLDIQRQRGGTPTFGDLCRLAHFYVVSMEAMTRRLEELRLVPAGVWDRLQHEQFKVEEARSHLGLAPVVFNDQLLPARYVALAVEGWQRGELSEGQLAQMLRTDRVSAREIIDRISGGENDGPFSFDLGAPIAVTAG